jgi:hypothetical protein
VRGVTLADISEGWPRCAIIRPHTGPPAGAGLAQHAADIPQCEAIRKVEVQAIVLDGLRMSVERPSWLKCPGEHLPLQVAG